MTDRFAAFTAEERGFIESALFNFGLDTNLSPAEEALRARLGDEVGAHGKSPPPHSRDDGLSNLQKMQRRCV